MRVYFIGTSHGVPEPHRRCSSYIVEVGGSRYIIDMGTQTVEDLRRLGMDIESVRLVICTHPHGDHTDGLISFTDLVNWYFKKADPLILLPDERLIPPLKEWLRATECGKPLREGLRIGAYSEGAVYEDEKLRLTAIPTEHCVNSYALLIEAEGKKLLFTGDLRHPTVDFPRVAFETELDLIVCELAHFSPDDCAEVFEKTKAKRIIHSHICDSRNAGALYRRLSEPHGYEYGAASDGMVIPL